MAGRAAKGLGVVIASRRLQVNRKGRNAVVVRLGMPRRRSPTEWRCPFHISGLGSPRVQYGVGSDAFQALLIGLGRIFRSLEESGLTMTWEFGNPGITGFSPIIPHFMEQKFFRKVERMIEDQLWQTAQAAARVRKRKKSGRKATTKL